MKIKINESESYEISVTEEYTLDEFVELSKRLNKIAETISTTPTSTDMPPAYVKKTKKKTKVDTSKISKKDDWKGKGIKCISCGSQRLGNKGYSKAGLIRVGCKNCGVSFTLSEDNEVLSAPRQLGQRRKPTKWKSKDEVLSALKIHYFGSKNEKTQFAEAKETTWDNVMKAIHGLRKRYNITPQEVGLREFPTRSAGRPPKTKAKPKVEESRASPYSIPTPHPPLELHKPQAETQTQTEETEEPIEPIEEAQLENEVHNKWWKKK